MRARSVSDWCLNQARTPVAHAPGSQVSVRHPMSDHIWAQDQIAAYVAGGLDAEESQRLEAHLRDCAACGEAFAQARTLDHSLASLFTPVKPAASLEDRMIYSLHVVRESRKARRRWARNALIGVAASVGLGGIGAGM